MPGLPDVPTMAEQGYPVKAYLTGAGGRRPTNYNTVRKTFKTFMSLRYPTKY